MADEFIPKPFSLKYKLDKEILNVPLEIVEISEDKENIKKILEDNVSEILTDGSKDIGDFMNNHDEFVRYIGDMSDFISDLDKRDKLDFMFVLYIGKSFNHLESYYRNADMTFLVAANKLNAFAIRLEEFTGKETKITILAENGFFDRYVLHTDVNLSLNVVKQAKEIMEQLGGFEKVEIKMLDDFLPEDIEDLSNKELEKSKNNPSGLNSKNIKNVFKVFHYSYPTDSFEEAVKLYSSKEGKEKVKRWEYETALRYLANKRARYNWGFWEKYKAEYIKSSDSRKSNTVYFDFHVGKLMHTHGVAVLEPDVLMCDHFYDHFYEVAMLFKIHERRLILHTFNGLPLFFEGENMIPIPLAKKP